MKLLKNYVFLQILKLKISSDVTSNKISPHSSRKKEVLIKVPIIKRMALKNCNLIRKLRSLKLMNRNFLQGKSVRPQASKQVKSF